VSEQVSKPAMNEGENEMDGALQVICMK